MIVCPYKCGTYLKDPSLLICRPKGILTADQMSDIATCRECIQKAGLEQINRFHDLRDITAINISFEDVWNIATAEAIYRSNMQRVIKACYLVHNSLLFGTIRMYQALIESRGVEVHVGYDMDELAKILDIDKARLLITDENIS